MDDDEFGDLYTDILLPSSSRPPQTLTTNTTTPSAAADDNDDWLLGPAAGPPAVDPTSTWDDDDDVVTAAPPPPPPPRVLDTNPEAGAAAARVCPIPLQHEDVDPLFGGGIGDTSDIPGLSAGPTSPPPPAPPAPAAVAASEEWDSDSEDDLQIVLNETDDRHQLGGEMGTGDDEEGEENLVAAGMEEQDWGEEAAQGGAADGERKDGGEAGKGGAAAPGGAAAAAGRIGYGGHHGFHTAHHSMYKYVRPGSTPGASVGGAPGPPGQFRPPAPSGPFAGRGRGDWRPVGGRGMMNAHKGFHSGYASWGSSGRGYGGGLDFTLPPHKTVFEVEIDSFEEKPWKYPGADISDFFNFGLDEEKWKDYCKQLVQLRLESTMQSRIRVYESGRSEQEYDPDLPPELAAAAGHHDISGDKRNNTDNSQADFSGQGRAHASMRPPLLTGRPIQVETGYGERLPSIDTRLPRMRESDAIIEIVLQDSLDDSMVHNGASDQPAKDSQGANRGVHGVEEDRHYASEKIDDYSAAGKNDLMRQVPFSSEGGNMLSFPVDAHARYPPNYKTSSPAYHGGRSPQGSSLGGHSGASVEKSNTVLPRQTSSSKSCNDSHKEKPVESSETKDESKRSPAAADEAADELSNGERLALVDSIEAEDIISDPHTFSETNGDDNLDHSGKKRKLSSRVEQPMVHDSSDQDEPRALHSDNSRGKSGSSKDHHKRPELGEEVVQDGRSRRVNDIRKHHDGEERITRRQDDYHRDVKADIERNRIASRGREDVPHPYAHRDRDIRGRSYERAKETDIWQRREDNVHNRRAKEEDTRLEYNAEASARHRIKARPSDRNDKDEDLRARKRLDDVDWRGSRLRERDDMVMNRREILDDSHVKRKRDEENLRRAKPDKEDIMHGYRARDDSSRRKKERDDGIDQKRRDDSVRMREKAEDHYRTKHKDDNLRHREREERQRPKQSHENKLTPREREEGRGMVRSGRVVDDKSSVGSGRRKDDLKSAALGKESQDRSRQNELSKRYLGGDENITQNKGRGDVHPRDKHSNNGERNLRQEKLNSHDNNRPSSASDVHQTNRDRHKENSRKGKAVESNEQDAHRPSKRRREDHENHRNDKVEMKGASEQESSSVSSAMLSKRSQNQIQEQLEVPQLHDPFVKQGEEDPMSDDDNQEDSRRGRSKLERWTSHKEIDYSSIDNETTETFSSIKADVQASDADVLGKNEASAAVGKSDAERTAEERDRHLDTVERLKRRSERFKLPMPGEKEAAQSKSVENELQPSQNEAGAADMEVKPERPARKRRWTGS